MARPRIRTGALRDTIVSISVDAFERDGETALQARRIATEAGTSTAAVHDLVGRRPDILRAMVREGFDRLNDRLLAVPESPNLAAEVIAQLAAVRAFALDHPRLYELMHAQAITGFELSKEDLAAALETYRRAMGLASRWLTDIGSPADPRDVANALVATNRGLIVTELSGQLGKSPESRARRWQFTIEALMAGLCAGPTS